MHMRGSVQWKTKYIWPRLVPSRGAPGPVLCLGDAPSGEHPSSPSLPPSTTVLSEDLHLRL